jgi:hypothetical protein
MEGFEGGISPLTFMWPRFQVENVIVELRNYEMPLSPDLQSPDSVKLHYCCLIIIIITFSDVFKE